MCSTTLYLEGCEYFIAYAFTPPGTKHNTLMKALLKTISHVATAALYLFALVYCFAVAAQAPKIAQPRTINIAFGNNSSIKYFTLNGTYIISFNNNTTINCGPAQFGQPADDSTVRRYSSHTIHNTFGNGRVHIFEHTVNGLRLQELFYTYTGKPYFFVQLKVIGKGAAAAYMSPFAEGSAHIQAGDDMRGLAMPFDNDMWARFNAAGLDTANYTSSEVTAIYSNATRRGLIIGSIEHGVWKSGIKVKHANDNSITLNAFAGLTDSTITHDKIPHGRVSTGNNECASPMMFMAFYDDWRTGMEEYAEVNKKAGKRALFSWNKATPAGWNSWGVMQTKLSLYKAKQVVDFFSDSASGFRNADNTLFIDLDSYWDNMVKGGLDGDVSQLKEFVRYCKQCGLKPGIYWGPFADWSKRGGKIAGSSYNYEDAWIKQNGVPVEVDGARAMDPTFPGTKERMAYYINHFKQWGFEMIKIDFLGHGAMENDHFYNPAVTTGMQAYRAGMEYLDSLLDSTMLVYAAISPTMATARYTHMRRIACDAFSDIKNTEYTLNSTGYGWWQSYLYNYTDADHVVFGKESAGENRARLASALVTGTLVTGDDYSIPGNWHNAAKNMLQSKDLLNILSYGRAFRPVEANTGKTAPELFTATINGNTYIAVFNYGSAAKSYTLPFSRLGISPSKYMQVKELFSGTTVKAVKENLAIELPAADAAIYCVKR